MNEVGMWMDRERRAAAGGETMPVENPATEEIIATVPRAQAADVAAAVKLARAAQPAWRRVPGLEKARLLHEVAV
jgi:aldehyde dehydrogenase (NAD+)